MKNNQGFVKTANKLFDHREHREHRG